MPRDPESHHATRTYQTHDERAVGRDEIEAAVRKAGARRNFPSLTVVASITVFLVVILVLVILLVWG